MMTIMVLITWTAAGAAALVYSAKLMMSSGLLAATQCFGKIFIHPLF